MASFSFMAAEILPYLNQPYRSFRSPLGSIRSRLTERSWKGGFQKVRLLLLDESQEKRQRRLPMLRLWGGGGWTPVFIIIDYGDTPAPPANSHKDFRHATNEIWKQLSALRQERHCCLVTATQADSASFDKATITRSNFSEDKRKLSHVTGMIGINQTPEEEDKGVIRLNWIVRREAEFRTFQCLHVATCLPICRPLVLSTF